MLHQLRRWARWLGRRRTVEDEMRAEMQCHLDRTAERLMARGLSREAARVEARREFGNVTSLYEEARDARGARWLEEFEQDLRIALRRLRHSPGLAIAIMLTIALGVGAAATIFSVAEAAFIAPLPYVHAERLVHLWESRVGTSERSPTSYPTLSDWRARLRSMEALEGYDPSNFVVGMGSDAEMRRGAEVTPGFFRLMGVQIAAGRGLANDDVVSNGGPVAVVSARLAHSAATSLLGQSIVVNGRPRVVVGVLPNDFHFALLQDADVFVPIVLGPQRRTDRLVRSLRVVGRLAPHVSLAAARTEIDAVMSQLAVEHPDALAGRTGIAVPLRDALLGGVRPILTTLLAAVALLLLAMGANLALLMFARYADRMPELHMRTVLGATRGHMLRQLFVEGVIPGAVGAALALAIGQVGTGALLDALPASVRIGIPYLANAGIDANVAALHAVLTTALVLVFAILPGMFITRGRRLATHLRTTLPRGDRRLRESLVAVQLVLTVVLLVCAGLLGTSFMNLMHRGLGFRDPAGLVAVTVPLSVSGARYQSPVRQRQFYEALLTRTAAMAGVRAVGIVNEGPGGGGGMTTFDRVDHPQPASAQARTLVRIVGGAYFETMGIPVSTGRLVDSHDRVDSPPVAVVSASLAKMLAPNGSAIGHRLRLGLGSQDIWTIVGVVGDVQAAALDAVSPPVIYVSHLQMAENRMTLIVRTQLSIATVRTQVRSIVRSIDAAVPVYAVDRVDRQLYESWAVYSREFPMILCGVFGLAALGLGLVALYAMCTHEITMRRREFGIRIALGATPRLMRRLVFRNGLRLAVLGVGGGILVALLVTRLMQTLLFGVGIAGWPAYGAAAGIVLGSSMVAMIGPARRVSHMSPGHVMRQE